MAIQATTAVASSATGALVGANFMLNLVLAASLNQLWSMMNGIQIGSHMTLLGISFPANTNVFMVFFVQIANFDLLPTDIVYPWFFTLPESVTHSANFATTGYESIYVAENLGTIFVMMHFYLLAYIFAGVFYILGKKWQVCAKVSAKLNAALFWNGLLRLFMEAYLEFSLAVILNLWYIEFDHENGAVLYQSICTLLYAIILFGLPVFVVKFYKRNLDKLDETEFKEKYGSVYEGLRLNERDEDENEIRENSLFYPAFFLMRRLIFSVIAIFMESLIVFQLAVLFACTITSIIYLIWFQPFESKFANRMEVLNDITTLLLLYLLMTFTPWVDDSELRFKLGYVFIGVMSTNIATHFFFLAKDTYR